MFEKILIANRGEIAIRIAQAAQEMEIKTVAVYSEPDKNSPHIFAADESYPLGGETSRESYLNMDKIIEAAKATGAQAIHPGYGFLSERAEFARKCWEAGIVFIGPHPDAIHKMGDKIEAKKLARAYTVPTIPGFESTGLETKILQKKAEEIGYPVIIKAAAGGGGKGMRVVHTSEELVSLLESAQREAKSAFGDERDFIEKYITSPRHIEIQILGDNFGNIIHLFERECSIQRRYQKIIEETPSTALTPELRKKMGEAAIKIAEAVKYNSAGTVEFVLDDKTKEFFFLEMNTRLQVEHPITEQVVGVDIVQWMIKIANGLPLTLTQAEIKQRGHAIECRVYAECVQSTGPNGMIEFRPSIGKIAKCELKSKIGVRYDTGIEVGSDISINYDPLLAKIIVNAQTRNEAIQKMKWSLSNYIILGVETNVEFLKEILDHSLFRAGKMTTHFIMDQFKGWKPSKNKEGVPKEVLIAQAIFEIFNPKLTANSRVSLIKSSASNILSSPWRLVERWGRNNLESTSSLVGLAENIDTNDLKPQNKK